MNTTNQKQLKLLCHLISVIVKKVLSEIRKYPVHITKEEFHSLSRFGVISVCLSLTFVLYKPNICN